MNRPEPKLAVSSHLAASTSEHPWPSFDGTRLPLLRPARQQLSRVNFDFKDYSTVAQRKSGLLALLIEEGAL
jgi:hypothetical protein